MIVARVMQGVNGVAIGRVKEDRRDVRRTGGKVKRAL